ncbi:MAG: NB-ARC domain-containing protein [Candidatus Binatia bacterium]
MATVYLSSTTKDLYEYREAVVAALHQLGHTIITREESDGRDDDALTNTYMFLSFCDLYVGIFAWRYGEIPAKANPEQLSLPVLEYRQADVFGLPRFIFLLDKNAPWPVSAQDNSTAHDIHDQRMRDFRKTLEREQAVRYFSWPEELATLVTTAVTLWEETQPENTADITPDETGDSGGERTTDVPPFEANGAQETAVPPTRLNRIFTPSLPFPYIPRPDELAQLRSAVLNYDHSHYRVPVALEGGAGTGKSVLATALCQDAQIQAAFPDGIFWVPMGDTPDDLLPPLRAIGRAFEDASTHYDTLESAHQRLAVLLHDKAVLLVLDNVCSQSQVELFHCDALNCRLLFTTRDAHLSLALGAQRVTLGSLSPPQAESLLREWALHDDPAFAAIAKRLGNLPLALKFVGMRLREGHDGNDWLAAFHHVSQLKLGRYAKTPGDNLELSFARSAQQLTEEDQVLYYALGIFPPEVPIPSSVVARLWQHLQPGLRQADCDDLLADLARRFLLERSVTEKTVSMREPLATYIRDQLGERYVSVTLALLTAYNPEAEPWPTVADDGYLYRYLTYHLHHAQQTDQLRQLLLDISWLEAKLLATNLPELLADFALIPEDTELQRVVSALALSAHILNADKTQLRSQIYGRLLAHELPQLSDTIEPTRAAPLWFRPLTPTLAAPGGPLVRTITGHPAVIPQ